MELKKDMRVGGGILLIIGIMMMLAPSLVGTSIAILMGLGIAFGGLGMLASSLSAHSLWGSVLGAALTLMGGYILFNPTKGSIALAALLGIYMIISGLIRILIGMMGRVDGRVGIIFSGLIALILGTLVWAKWPDSGEVAVGILLGIDFVVMGTMLLLLPSALDVVEIEIIEEAPTASES